MHCKYQIICWQDCWDQSISGILWKIPFIISQQSKTQRSCVSVHKRLKKTLKYVVNCLGFCLKTEKLVDNQTCWHLVFVS